jgi:hypothetical protein
MQVMICTSAKYLHFGRCYWRRGCSFGTWIHIFLGSALEAASLHTLDLCLFSHRGPSRETLALIIEVLGPISASNYISRIHRAIQGYKSETHWSGALILNRVHNCSTQPPLHYPRDLSNNPPDTLTLDQDSSELSSRFRSL